jgi:hypothetical protein
VLVVEVPAPKSGERQYPLATGYEPDERNQGDENEKSGASSGTFFIRRGSKTERANYAEATMLIDRALQGTRKGINDLGLVVKAMATPDFRTLDVSESAVNWWLQQRRQALLDKTKDTGRRHPGMNWLWSDSNIRAFADAVDDYIGRSQQVAEGILVATFLYQGFNGFTVFVDNPSDEYLPDVQAVLSLPASCSVIERSRLDYGRFPDPPVVIQGNNWATNKSSRGAKIHMSRQAVQVSDDRVRYTEDLGLIRAQVGYAQLYHAVFDRAGNRRLETRHRHQLASIFRGTLCNGRLPS